MLPLLLALPVVPMHLGALHPVEKLLTLLLAFGPFVALGAVIWLRKRSDAARDAAEAEDGTDADADEHALDG